MNKVMEGPPLQIKKEKGSSLEQMNGRDPSFNTEREVVFLRMKGSRVHLGINECKGLLIQTEKGKRSIFKRRDARDPPLE